MDGASVAFIVCGSLVMCALHPRVNPKNYTFEESVCIIAYTMGFLIGAHIARTFGLEEYILCTDDTGIALRCIRVVLGYAVVLPAKALVKELTKFMRTTVTEKNIDTYQFSFGDFVSRLLQYGLGYGVGCTLFAPFLFKFVGI